MTDRCNVDMSMPNGKYDNPQPTIGVKQFGERLKTAIGDKRVSSISKCCGLSEAAIRKYLKNGSLPCIDKAAAISEATGTSLVWLITGAGSQYQDDKQLKTAHLSEEEFNKWWGTIADALRPEEKFAVVSTFKQGGLKALFSTELLSDKN